MSEEKKNNMGFLSSLIGSGLGAGASIVSTILGNRAAKQQQATELEWQSNQAQINRDFNALEAEKARDFNASEAEKARLFNANESQLARQYNTAEREATQAWNLEQWNRENEYNSPVAQMERMKAAGINPNSAAANISGGNASQVLSSPQSGPSASGPAASGPAASGTAASLPGSIAPTLANLIGNSANNAMSNAMVTEQIESLNLDNIWKKKEKPVAYEQAVQNLKNSKLEGQDLEIGLKLQHQLYDMNVLRNPLELKQIQETVNKLTAEQDLIKKQASTEEAKKENLEANTDLLGVEVDKVKAETERTEQETLRMQWANLFREQFGFDPDQGWVQQLITASVEGKLPTIFGEIVESNADNDTPGLVGDMFKGIRNIDDMFTGKYDWSNDPLVRGGKKLWNWMIHGKQK